MADQGMVDGLRRQVFEVSSRHAADGRVAAERFWAALKEGFGDPGVTPGAATPPPAGGLLGPGTRVRSAQGAGARTSRRRRVGHGGAAVRGHAMPRRGGPWGLFAADDEVRVRPREVGWLEHESLAADAVPVAVPGGEPIEGMGSVGVVVEATVGMSLVRHGEAELVAAVACLGAARAGQEVALVSVVAELEARGVDSPGGLSRVDWLRSVDPSLSAGAARDVVTVARALTDPRWAELAARVAMRQVSVGKAARIIAFHEQVAPVADPQEVAAAVADLLGQAASATVEEVSRLARHH
ncbi:MAG TPA: HNH endonuclease, partial [Intrasporangium sp.]|nr:HNH endonuclease [Intrasporangium sp.]